LSIDLDHAANAVQARPGPSDTRWTIAQQLAPIVHLHPNELHFPCSVDWYLQRCYLVSSPSDDAPKVNLTVAPALALTSQMSVARAGPLDQFDFNGYRSLTFGSAANTDRYFLWPMEAAPGQGRTSDWRNSSKLWDYQRETTYGFRSNPGTAPCYCNIVSNADRTLHRITYYFFYGYNGGLGPTTKWDGEPLGLQCGYGAHFGDWERMTVIVQTSSGSNNIQIRAILGEQHGDEVAFDHPDTIASPDQFARINVYSAWHSHATYPNAGTHRWGVDFTSDDGAAWDTRQNLTAICRLGGKPVVQSGQSFTDRPIWVYFNGDWGPRVVLQDDVISLFEGTLVGGPSGPAFKDFWALDPDAQYRGSGTPLPGDLTVSVAAPDATGRTYVWAYSAQGTTCINRIASGGMGYRQTYRKEWSSGFSGFAGFEQGDEPYVWAYRAYDGMVCIQQIVQGGDTFTQKYTSNWDTGYSSFTSAVDSSGNVYIWAYRNSDGQVCIHQVASGGSGFSQKSQQQWDTGFSNSTGFSLSGSPYLWTYRDTDGTVCIHQINSGGTGFSQKYSGQWDAGFSSFAAATDAAGAAIIWAYRASDGTVCIHQINANGAGFSQKYKGQWDTGFTCFAGFVQAGALDIWAYRTGDATVCIHRIADNAGGFSQLFVEKP
jgi:Vacuolar protein sorting-associated protein 62